MAAEIVCAWLHGLGDKTKLAYRSELASFASFCGYGCGDDLVWDFVQNNTDPNGLISEWLRQKDSKGNSQATINRSLSAMKSLFRTLRQRGLITYEICIPSSSLESRGYEWVAPDDLGPRLMSVASEQKPHFAARDMAIITLAYGFGLNREEISLLDVGHVDIEKRTLELDGNDFELQSEDVAILSRWLKFRHPQSGRDPLFVSGNRIGANTRLSGGSIYSVIQRLGEMAGIHLTPRKLRQAFINHSLSHAVDARQVMSAARVKSLRI